ncbi:DMT family transporter [Gallibacterium salpingitidis]|uniref:Membrane protein n=1 Tax=Gallibacterium salpingitidis TaxID=505341 RepID=A0A1A7P1T1_9PAST|nr:DMT family transporter [Gallibacterium salpingitidis]OBW96392.1 membrane protein [Gallibacterium salpingitidis]
MQKQRLAIPGIIIGCVVFGLGSLIVAHVPVGAYAIAFWRLLIASVIFFLLAKCFKQRLPKSKKAIGFALTSGIFLAFDLAFWHESVYAVGPGISTLLNSLQIFFLSAISFFYFKEKLSIMQLISLLLAIIGVYFITGSEFAYNENALWGFTTGIISSLLLALSMVFIRKTHEVEPTPIFPMMLLISLGGAAILILPSLLFNADNLYPTNALDWFWIFVYGAVMQCFAWGMIAYCVPLLSLALTGLLLLSEPIAALVIDYSILDKPINLIQWGGAAVTMFAIYLGSVSSQPRKAKIRSIKKKHH